MMETQILGISGMSCEACAGHVTRALQALSGMQSVRVSLDSSEAIVIFDPARVSTVQIAEAVAEEGYEATLRA